MGKTTAQSWFDNCGGWFPNHNLDELQAGIAQGWLNEQDKYVLTGLCLAASSGWKEGVAELIKAGADTELRDFRTGETALYIAVIAREEPTVTTLLESGANPEAANHWGITPRQIGNTFGLGQLFEGIPMHTVTRPAPLIQNAEHLADHYSRFKIPKRTEREALQPGQAVDLYVYGPKSEDKQDTVKVRISARKGSPPDVRYIATIETPMENIHLPPEVTEVEFGPEHVATVYIPRKQRTRKRKTPN